MTQPGPAPGPQAQRAPPVPAPALLENSVGHTRALLGARSTQAATRRQASTCPGQSQLPRPRLRAPRFPSRHAVWPQAPHTQSPLPAPPRVAPEERSGAAERYTHRAGWRAGWPREPGPERTGSRAAARAARQTGHTWAAAPQAWCGQHREQERQAGDRWGQRLRESSVLRRQF